MLEKATGCLREKSGKYSASRIAFLLSLTLVMVPWAYISYKTHTMVDIPNNVLALILGTGGLKTVQSFSENKDTTKKVTI